MDRIEAEKRGKEFAWRLVQTIMEQAYGPNHDREPGEPERKLFSTILPACIDYGMEVIPNNQPN